MQFPSVFTGNTVPQTGSTPLMVAGVLGEAVTLPLQLSAGRETEYITWLHNGTSIVFIQVNQVGSPQIMVTDPRRKDRLQVTQTHSLQLSNLMMADVGTHHILITTKTSILLSDYTPRSFSESGPRGPVPTGKGDWAILWAWGWGLSHPW